MRKMISTRCGVIALLTATHLTATTVALADDWAQWRGPYRDGHVPHFKNPAVWPKTLVKRWSVAVGQGHSSPIIVGDRAFVLVRRENKEHTLCIDLKNGRTVWEDVVDAPFDSVIFPAQRLGKAPRSTPLWHQGKLYTTGVNGLFSCLDAATGKPLWRRDFSTQFKIPMPICGASLSPLIDGRIIYLHVGHDNEGAFIAMDKDTGKEVRRTDTEGPAYASPVLARIGGKRQIITATHNQFVGIDPENGAILWSLGNRRNMFNHNSITPVVLGDTVFVGGNQRPTMALRIRANGNRWTADKVWETLDVTLSTSSPVLSGNQLYLCNEKRRGQITVLDTATGKSAWVCEGNKGENVSLYDVGPSLLAFTAGGDLFVYKKTGNTLTETARYPVADSAMWASPAISGNRLLVKGAENLTLWTLPTP
ncbi:MAG: PQQ-binding-like beta-propeller repeat protein [Capsulimonadales bacterium]|nr:PQQ-binding-like beta-propeller repeat protein [Capsulimonadales bacterium]